MKKSTPPVIVGAGPSGVRATTTLLVSIAAATALSHVPGERQGKVFQGKPEGPKDDAGNLARAKAKREKRRAKRIAIMNKNKEK